MRAMPTIRTIRTFTIPFQPYSLKTTLQYVNNQLLEVYKYVREDYRIPIDHEVGSKFLGASSEGLTYTIYEKKPRNKVKKAGKLIKKVKV